MRYLPHTPEEIDSMLRTIGAQSVEELFQTIPDALQLKRPLSLPPPLPEVELRHLLREMSRENAHGEEWASFLGGGIYSHTIPSAVGQLLSRGEFLTAYTPYQPEVSQGTLQSIFEYQTMAAEVLGMEVANASVYDGSSGTAEAVLMAQRINNRPKILVSKTVPPEYREVLATYLSSEDGEVVTIPYTADGTLDREAVSLDKETSCLVVGTPNFFGIVEDFSDLAARAHDAGALLITTTPEPLSLGLFKSPGEMGADIAVAEGQGFGNSVSFGGPSLGLFAARRDFVRSLPGRIVGETVDQEGRRGFVLTLATREQHIRRERATSNICTNVALCALAATITLALWGRSGFEKLARLNYQRSESLKKRLASVAGARTVFPAPTFNEFVVKLSRPVADVLKKLREEKILGGIPLARWYPELSDSVLISVTELTHESQIERLIRSLETM